MRTEIESSELVSTTTRPHCRHMELQPFHREAASCETGKPKPVQRDACHEADRHWKNLSAEFSSTRKAQLQAPGLPSSASVANIAQVDHMKHEDTKENFKLSHSFPICLAYTHLSTS